MMQFVRDNDAVGAILAGAGSRPAEELVTALRKGGYLRKYGRFGKPKQHWFRLSHDDKELLWDSSSGKIRSIALLSVSRIVQGQTTPVFRREPLPDYEAVSFSLLYSEGKGSAKERSLDLVCRNSQEFETWFLGIQLVIVLNQNLALQQQQNQAANGQAAAAAAVPTRNSGSGSVTPLRKQSSGALSPRRSEEKVDKMQEFRQIAASLQPVKAALTGSTQRSISRELALSAKREIGDCYIWGSLGEADACDPSDGALQCCGLPAMVANTHALDVIQVAVGPRHAALLTRGGEVYTWGSGMGGNGGNGTAAGSNYPQQVTRLTGKGTAAVACGNSYTAAVLSDGSLCTWGSGLGGQLGLGPNVTAAVWPTRVMAGLEGVRVSQVSCGPYHAAAIGSDGRLFTWGDGLFGKLGHGDHCTSPTPRFVTTLAEHWVISVSCGWWHTAAAAVARARLTGRGVSSASLDSYVSDTDSTVSAGPVRRSASNSGSFLRGNIVSSSGASPPPPEALSPAAAAGIPSNGRALLPSVLASRAADMGGAIFTWGGDFRWQQPWAKDHHQGCLGVGDLSGRLVPTLVKGEDNHVQVACGLNFTVALTNNGEVYQMGNTGAQNNREKDKADWKNALVPVLVRGQLSNHSVERLAAGMSHVAVVATQRTKTNSGSGSTQTTRLLTWGKNTAGQLGIGAGREDHFMPQPVNTLQGRRILFLTCGGSYTLAVCEHDPKSRWSRDSLDEGALTSAQSGSLVSSSGPSRLLLAGGALTPGGSSGGPGGAADRAGLAAAANSGGMLGGASGVQRAGGTGGMTVSASLSSLASSVASGSRGEGGGAGGSGGGSMASGLARKSDRGRLESRYSDRGFPVHAGPHGHGGSNNNGSSRELQHVQQQHPQLAGTRSMGVLSRSFDRSLGGLGPSGGGAGGAHHGQHGLGPSYVSWAASPGEGSSSRSLLRMGHHSSKGFGQSPGAGNSLGVQDMSLQALASASKKQHHLPLPKSFKKLASRGRSDNRHATWADWQSQGQPPSSGNTRGPGASTPKEQCATSARTTSRQLSYSARSEPDLATVSASSSMTSAALSMTPSPSIHSMQEGRVAEGLGDVQGSSSEDFQRQLRYWQERAANMEQQLSRRTHELESLRRELRFSNTSQGTAASDSAHHSNLRPSSLDMRSSGSGAAAAGADGGRAGSSSTSNLAMRRGLQPLAPVATAPAGRTLADGALSSSDVLGQSSASSSMAAVGTQPGSAAATPAEASSSGASSAAGATTGAAALMQPGPTAGAAGSPSSPPPNHQQPARLRGVDALHPPLGSYPLPSDSPGPQSAMDSPSDSMQDAREDWASPGSESDTAVGLEGVAAVADGDEDGDSIGVSRDSMSLSGATATTQGSGSTGLHRGTSLATWIGGDMARGVFLRKTSSLANGVNGTGSAGTSASGGTTQAEGLQQQHPQHLQQQHAGGSFQRPRRSTTQSFVFSPVDQQEGPTGLAALREAAEFTSEDTSPFAAAAAGADANGLLQQRPRQGHKKHVSDGDQQQRQQQQEDMFRVMSEHSQQASRVLALFQQSQRQRQQQEQQQLEQQQAGVELPLLPPSDNAGSHADNLQPVEATAVASGGTAAATAAEQATSAAAGAGGGTADAAADASKRSEPPDASGAAADAGAVGAAATAAGADLPLGVAAAGPVSLLNVAATDEAELEAELEALREQNRLLQQQLQELRQQQQQQPPAVVATLPAPVTAGRSSLGNVGSGAGALGGGLSKHRRAISVDIGSTPNVTREVAKGVYLSLQALPYGGYELKRVRFAKQMFSSEDAEQWWNANRERIYAAFNISQQHPAPSWQQHPGQQGQQSPELLSQQQQLLSPQLTSNGSGVSRMLLSLNNPHPLGGPSVGSAAAAVGLRELLVKRTSNGGDWTPPGTSPCVTSPHSSTMDLDPFSLPPSALLDAAFAAAHAHQAQAQDAQQQQAQQQGQQQHTHPRGWAGVSVSVEGPTVSRSSSLGPSSAAEAAAAAGATGLRVQAGSRLSQSALPGDPDGGVHSAPLSPQQQVGVHSGPLSPPSGGAGAGSSVLSSTGSGIDLAWQPVLPRKGSLGPGAAAAGPETPARLSAAGGPPGVEKSGGKHSRTGSGLFRWLSKNPDSSISGSL